MQTWEYLVRESHDELGAEGTEDWLSKWGQQGYELVSVSEVHPSRTGEQRTYIFKRPAKTS